MNLLLAVLDEDPRYASSLYDWLCAEDELRGFVTLTHESPKTGEMGNLANIVTVALGSGGIASVLIGSVCTWMTQRHNKQTVIKATTKNGASVEFSGQGNVDIETALKRVIDGARELDQ